MIGIIKNTVNLIGNKMLRNNNDFFHAVMILFEKRKQL